MCALKVQALPDQTIDQTRVTGNEGRRNLSVPVDTYRRTRDQVGYRPRPMYLHYSLDYRLVCNQYIHRDNPN